MTAEDINGILVVLIIACILMVGVLMFGPRKCLICEGRGCARCKGRGKS